MNVYFSKSDFFDAEISAYRLENDLHEQVLCLVHALDSRSLVRLYAVLATLKDGSSATVYIPEFRAGADASETARFCGALAELFESLGDVAISVCEYCEEMKETLSAIDCSLIFEAM